MTTSTFSAKARQALAHIEQGAKFFRQLEQNNYTGHNHWCYRLVNSQGYTIKGFGFKTYDELNRAGVRGLVR